MKIGELSRQTGVSIRMLRYYEQVGLLKPQRTSSGYRHYTDDDVAKVRGVLLLNKAGLPLAAIRPLLICVPLEDSPAPLCKALKEKITAQLKQIDEQASLLNQSRRRLARLL